MTIPRITPSAVILNGLTALTPGKRSANLSVHFIIPSATTPMGTMNHGVEGYSRMLIWMNKPAKTPPLKIVTEQIAT
jgi:hypothetical protein